MVTARVFLFLLIALLGLGCQNEENSPNECGETELLVDGTPYNTSAPRAAFMERGNKLRLDLYTLAGKDTLYLQMFLDNWPLISSSPSSAFVNTFKKNAEYVNCISSTKSFENCAVLAGHGAIIKEEYTYMMLEDDRASQIRVLYFDRSEKKVSGDFNFKAAKIGKNGLGDTVEVAGRFTDVCFTPYQ